MGNKDSYHLKENQCYLFQGNNKTFLGGINDICLKMTKKATKDNIILVEYKNDVENKFDNAKIYLKLHNNYIGLNGNEFVQCKLNKRISFIPIYRNNLVSFMIKEGEFLEYKDGKIFCNYYISNDIRSINSYFNIINN
jgi:hypothetical protein